MNVWRSSAVYVLVEQGKILRAKDGLILAHFYEADAILSRDWFHPNAEVLICPQGFFYEKKSPLALHLGAGYWLIVDGTDD